MNSKGNGATTAVARQPATTRSGGALASVEPQLAAWMPAHDTLPAPLPVLREALAEVMESLRPIDLRELTIVLDETLALWRTPEQFEGTAEFYVEALEDAPRDLALAACKAVRVNHGYASMPLPGDFRRHVKEELARRKSLAVQLRLAVGEAERRGDARPVGPIDETKREQWRSQLRDLAAELGSADRPNAKAPK